MLPFRPRHAHSQAGERGLTQSVRSSATTARLDRNITTTIPDTSLGHYRSDWLARQHRLDLSYEQRHTYYRTFHSAIMASSSPEELLKTAEKRAASTGGFFSFGSSSSTRLEEAAELYKAAANKFRAANRFDEAGHAFMKAAETEVKAGEVDYAANTFFEASKSFKMTRPERG